MDDNDLMRAILEGQEVPPTDENLRRLEELMGRMYPDNPGVTETMRNLASQYRAQGLVLREDPNINGQPGAPGDGQDEPR